MRRLSFPAAAALGTCLALAACSDDASLVEIVGLSDGSILGGPSLTAIDIDDSLTAVRVELYLDNVRIAEDDFAPFVLAWSTADFADGKHRLRARVYLTDDTYRDGTTDVILDNTAPTVGDLPTLLARHEVASFYPTDANGIAQVTVKTVSGEASSTNGPRFTVTWDAPCGPSAAEITVTDRAGWTTSARFMVTTSDRNDLDCDGYASIASGGLDCNDGDARFHPAAADPGGVEDFNCDGVLGVDADRDGLASVATGGTDCDDKDASVHPGYMRVPTKPLAFPTPWERDEVAVVRTDKGWSVFVVENGAIVHYAVGSDGSVLRERIANGAVSMTAAWVGSTLTVASTSNTELTIHRRLNGRWTQEIIPIDYFKVGLEIAGDAQALYVAYSNVDGTHVMRIADGKRTVFDVPNVDWPKVSLWSYADSWTLTYLSGGTVQETHWRDGQTSTWRADEPTLMGARTHVASNGTYAVLDGGTTRVYRYGSRAALATIAGDLRYVSVLRDNDLVLQPSTGPAVLVRGGHTYRTAARDVVASAATFEGQLAFAGRGILVYDAVAVDPPLDPPGGVDADCDGAP